MPSRDNLPYGEVFIQVIDYQKRVFRSGDVVSGLVRVNAMSRPRRVVIRFRGRMKCAIQESNGNASKTYKEKPDYFLRSQELFRSNSLGTSYDILLDHGVTEDDRVELPFQFTWPDRTEIDQEGRWKENPKFEHTHGGPLPPSHTRYGTCLQIVEYFLEAEVRGEKVFEARLPLKYRPVQSIPSHIPNLRLTRHHANTLGIRAYTYKLHPDWNPNEGLRARLKRSWAGQDEETPWARYRIGVACPAAVTEGKPIRFEVRLEHMERSDNLPDPPPVFLSRLEVKLYIRLDVRVPRHSLRSHDKEHSYMDKIIALDERARILVYDGMMFETPALPKSLAPAFRTYGLALSHELKFELHGDCGRETFHFVSAQGEVTVIAQTQGGVMDIQEGVRAELDGPAARLPVYEEVLAESSSAGTVLPPSLAAELAPPPYKQVPQED